MLRIDALLGMKATMVAAILTLAIRDELYDAADPTRRLYARGPMYVLEQHEATPETVRGMTLLGAIPPNYARHAEMVVAPKLRGVSGPDETIEEIRRRFAGLTCVRVEDLGAPQEPAEVIAMDVDEPYVVSFIRLTDGLAMPDAPVLIRPERDEIAGKHVVGVLNWQLATHARCITGVPLGLANVLQSAEVTGEVLADPTVQQVIRAHVEKSVFSYKVYPVDPA
jgi:hypothetical protein